MLATEKPAVAKVIAFSPGEYMNGKTTVHDWYAKVKIPILAVWASGEDRLVKQIMSGTKALVIGDESYVHGSSTLRPDKDVPNQEELWKQVETFLNAN
jgi:hypothetical protein